MRAVHSEMKLGVLLFPAAEELDFVGPWEMLTMWRQVAGGPDCLLVAEHPAPVLCAKGMTVLPHVSFADCPALDFLLVPGGQGTRREVDNPKLVEFVATQARSCRAVLSVCTGAFILHAAGLLSGKLATTHWASLDRLRALGDVRVVEQRFTRDGKVWCAAGVSAGIDLALHFIAEVAGDEAAGKVQLAAEYFPSTVSYGGAATNPRTPAYARGEKPGEGV